MQSVFSKRLIVMSVAGMLLSLGANAMNQLKQQQDQWRPGAGLTKPPTECPSVSCVQTRNEATWSLKGATTVHVRKLTTVECQLTQGDSDRLCGNKTYPIKKICGIDNSQCSNQQKDGYQCGGLDVQPISSNWSTVADGSKTGNAEYQHLEEYELTLRGGDSKHEVLPCSKASAEEVMAGLPSELSHNFSLSDVQGAMRGIINDLEKTGPVTTIDKTKKVIVEKATKK